jgi:FixJ family two-component response regulator
LKKTHAFVICLLDDEELLQSVQKALTRSIQQRRRSTEKTNARHLLDLLTPREFQVMELVVAGMLNKQIAGELGTAEKTVKVPPVDG